MRGEKERQEQASKLAADLLEQFRSLYLYSLREVVYEKSLKEFHIADGASISISSPSSRSDRITSPRRNRSASTDGSPSRDSGSFNLHRRTQSNTAAALRKEASGSGSGFLRKQNSHNEGLRSLSSPSNNSKRQSKVVEVIGNIFHLNSPSSTPPPTSIMDKLRLPITTTNFSTKVICAQEVELPDKTKIVYAISSKLGDDSALVYKEFKEFKELHSFLKRNEPHLSPRATESKIESRNLRSELIASREQMLGEYLEAVTESPDAKHAKDIHLWLGLGLAKDDMYAEAFRRAFYRLKAAHSMWKRSITRGNSDALFQFICSKIKQEVFAELNNHEPLPHKEIARFTEEYKSCTHHLEVEIERYFLSLNREAVQSRAEVKVTLDKNIYHIEKIETNAKLNARKLLSEVFRTAWPKFEVDLKLLVTELHAPLMKSLHKLTHFQILHGSLNMPVNFDDKMKEILSAATPEKIDNFERIFLRLKQTVKSHLTIQLSFALPHIVEKLKRELQTDSLHFLDSVPVLPNLLSAVLDLIDPATLFLTVRQILDCKYALLQEHPANSKRIEEILDRHELLTQDKIWWSRREVVCAGHEAYFKLWEVVGNLGPYAELFKEFVPLVESLYKKILTKLSHTFGDLVHEAILKEIRDWKSAIDAALLGAYEAAKKTAFKHLRIIIHKFVVNIIKEGIKPQVQNIVVGPINIFVDSSQPQGMPTDVLDQIKGQDRLYEEVFDDLLREHVEGLVTEICGHFHLDINQEFAA